MFILTFNTLSNNMSVAIAKYDKIISKKIITQPSRHSELLISTIQDALTEAKIDYQDLDLVAMPVYPGSFTSSRISYVAANIMRLALKISVIALDKSDIMAWKYRNICSNDLLVIFACNNHEFYVTKYQPFDRYLNKKEDTKIYAMKDLCNLIAGNNYSCVATNKSQIMNFDPKLKNKLRKSFLDLKENEVEIEDIVLYANYVYSNNSFKDKILCDSNDLKYLRQPNIN